MRQHSGDSNMKLVLLITLLVAGAVAAGPTECNECVGVDEASCSARGRQRDQVCATDRNSLGTTHCGTAVGKYRDNYPKRNTTDVNVDIDIFFRGCFDCANKKEACFALGGFLKGDESWTLMECEIECCTSDNCNTQVPTLSKDAITVFTPNATGPK
ncbi:hypothetical protein OS493_032297 [Desmophyllum pertusum]|uniref:Sodefrin-like factor n=1 Tax=Desmophyllum pertusum TaxID=174260 RepID=A0A9X0CNN5_9CNID|nr:hypothetical protein OS493_032297 [Desmophyllum pertusum]